MEGGSACSPAGTSKAAEAISLTDFALERLDVRSVGQHVVYHHTEVDKVAIVGQDVEKALDVIVVEVKGSGGSLRCAQL